MNRHDELVLAAERRHGLLSREVVHDLGHDRHVWTRLRRSKEWEPLSENVLRRRGSAPTREQRMLAAVLDVGRGALLYGESAAAHWALPGFAVRGHDPVHVVRPEGVRPRPSELAVVHTTVRQTTDPVRALDRIPLSSPVQTIFDLARTCSLKRLERALDNAWSMRLLCGAEMHDELEVVARSGRDGITNLRELLAVRGRDYIPPASGLEARFSEITERAGRPTMERQVNVGNDERWVGRVDFRHRELPLIVEVNSERFHAALVDVAADELRYERLRRAGYEVVVVWDHEVFHSPRRVRARIAAAERRVRSAAASAA